MDTKIKLATGARMRRWMVRKINWKKPRKRLRFRMELVTPHDSPAIPIDAFASAKRADYLNRIERMTSNSLDMSKWLLASLLALNSGGLFALLANLKVIGYPLIVGSCFCLGIGGALLNGWLIQWAEIKNMNWHYDASQYWLISQIKGTRWRRSEFIIWKNAVRAQRRQKWVALPGWLSTAFFFAGAIVGACSLH